MKFEIKKLSYDEVKNLLIASENDYEPVLSQLIDIDACTRKWSEKAWFLLGKEGDDVVSVLVFYRNDTTRSLYIAHFSVSSRFRHSGVGHRTLEALIRECATDYQYIDLEAEKNGIAHKFYIREGFSLKEDKKNKVLLTKVLYE